MQTVERVVVRRRLLRGVVVALLGLSCLGMQQVDNGLDWYELLEKPDAVRLTTLADNYENAAGVRRDYARARQLYCAAARLGHLPAQVRLAWMYANGVGTPQDKELAGAWLRVAAASGDRRARNFLAYLDYPQRGRKPRCTYASRYDRYAIATITSPPSGDAATPADKSTPSWSAGTDMGDVSTRPTRQQVESWVHLLAPRYGLDADLVMAIIRVESNFDARALSHKNAWGLMQLIPDTAARFGVEDITHPVQNLHGGMAYLRWLLAYFQGDLRLALAGYNAGEGAVEKYRGIPPYRETKRYVRKVIHAYGRDTHPRVEPVVTPSRVISAALGKKTRR
jgi:soluble lytic murein transglycosylase-like protein